MHCADIISHATWHADFVKNQLILRVSLKTFKVRRVTFSRNFSSCTVYPMMSLFSSQVLTEVLFSRMTLCTTNTCILVRAHSKTHHTTLPRASSALRVQAVASWYVAGGVFFEPLLRTGTWSQNLGRPGNLQTREAHVHPLLCRQGPMCPGMETGWGGSHFEKLKDINTKRCNRSRRYIRATCTTWQDNSSGLWIDSLPLASVSGHVSGFPQGVRNWAGILTNPSGGCGADGWP